MKKTAATCAVLALVMAGCASGPQEQQGPTMAEVAASNHNTAGQDGHQMTGSRLKDRTSTDRMLKAVGAQGARDEINQAPRPLNAGG